MPEVFFQGARADGEGVTLYCEGLVYSAGQSAADDLLARYLERGRRDPDAFFAAIDGQCTVAIADGGRVLGFRSLLAPASLYFSSGSLGNRLQAIYLAAGRPPRSAEYLVGLLTDRPGLRYDSPLTPFEGIQRLAPGQRVELRAGETARLSTIKQLPEYRFRDIPGQRLEDVVPRVRELLDGAIEARLAPNRPVACELSGGLDSSFVASLLGRRGRPVKAFMYSFPKLASHRFSEECAREVARHYAIDLTVLAPEDLGRADLTARQPYRDEPTDFFWQGVIFGRATDQLLDENSVLFSGYGADQLFLLDPVVLPWLLAGGRLREFSQTLREMARSLERSQAHLAWQAALSCLPRPIYRRANRFFDGWRFNPLAIEELEPDVALAPRPTWARWPEGLPAQASAKPSALSGRVRLEFSYLAVPALNTDPYYRPRGIESVHPYCDKRLIDFMLNEVGWQLVHDWKNPYKHLLREAQKGIVPERVRTRPKNEFFFNGFLAQMLRDNADYLRALLREASVPEAIELDREALLASFDELIFGVSNDSVDCLLKLVGYLYWWRDFSSPDLAASRTQFTKQRDGKRFDSVRHP